jgi:hypothetical protein
MKKNIQYISLCLFVLLAFSCNNDFLTEKPVFSTDASVLSDIYVAPEWEANECHIQYNGAGNAKFSVVNAPEWLNILSSGQFYNDLATVRCSANRHNEFSGVGIYNSIMTIEIEGQGKVAVPVAYVVEGNPVIETVNKINLTYNYGAATSLSIKNRGAGILLWAIVECPEWLAIDYSMDTPSTGLLPQNAESSVYISCKEQNLTDSATGRIVIASNDKNNPVTVIEVTFDAGSPIFHCDYNLMDFGRQETTQNFWFLNNGDGLLIWTIEDYPEWIRPAETHGTLSAYNGTSVNLTCDRNKAPAGANEAVITVKTNDKANPSYSITVKCNNGNNPFNLIPIDGTIMDAWMDKDADLLYLTTSQPNRLIAYNVKSKTIDREVILSKAPTCFSISEDGHKAIVGHGGMISSIDMDNFSVTKTTNVGHVIFDIEWGANEWVCYTVGNGAQWTNLYWVNLLTNAVETGEQTYENCMIKKAPHTNYILGSEINLSSGIYLFDINTRKRTTDIFDSFGYFWFSADATYIFDSWKRVYRTSTVVEQKTISPIDQLTYHLNKVTWIDHDAKTNSLWVVPSVYPYPFNTNAEVFQMEATDYTVVKTYNYDDYYKATDGIDYKVQARYAFVNSAGTELMVVKGVFRDYTPGNAWSIEHIPVTK